MSTFLFGQRPVEIYFCGELSYDRTDTIEGSYYLDRFGNKYAPEDLDLYLQPSPIDHECNDTGVFSLFFSGTWTEDEQNTVCEAFYDASQIIAPNQNDLGINIQLVKGNFPNAAAASNFFDPTNCGIINSTIHQVIHGNTSYPSGFTHGIIEFQVNPTGHTWHTLADDVDTNNDQIPDLADTEIDLYTATLHEIGHLLGFASLISETGSSAANEPVYSRWDLHLYGDDDNAHLLVADPTEDCCDFHTFNSSVFQNMPNDVLGDCFVNIFFEYDGSLLAEVNDIAATAADQIPNKLSHLDKNCNPGEDYLM